MEPTPEFLDWWNPLESLLLRALVKKGVSTDVAEDIIQEIAVVVLWQVRSLGSYNGFLSRFQSFAQLAAWARIRAGWMLIDRVRAEKRLENREDAGREVSMHPNQEMGVHLQELWNSINNLPDRQRLALTGMLEGASSGEIASQMGITEASVRSLQRFGKSRLAHVLLEPTSKETREEK